MWYVIKVPWQYQHQQYVTVYRCCASVCWNNANVLFWSPLLQSADISLHRSLCAKWFVLDQAVVFWNWMEISSIPWLTSLLLSFLFCPQKMGFYYVYRCVITQTHSSLGFLCSHDGPVMRCALHMSPIFLSHQGRYRLLVGHTVKKSFGFQRVLLDCDL